MLNQIGIDELKRIQLDILLAVHDFCVKNELHYSLAYGTLIGAIRHKGYIPWDDDIDIMMPRDDYEYFIRAFNGNYPDLFVISPESKRDYYAPYANVYNQKTTLKEMMNERADLGVKIDVFPIDHVSDYSVDRHRMFKKTELLKRLSTLQNNGNYKGGSAREKVAIFLVRTLFSHVHFPYILSETARRENNKNMESNTVNNIVWCAQGEKACFSIDDIESYIDVTFEGFSFKAIQGYDHFLRAHYGDYMQLPPKEQRVAHHGFVAYWK